MLKERHLQPTLGRHENETVKMETVVYLYVPQSLLLQQNQRKNRCITLKARCSSAPAALRSPATKQRARPHRCHRKVARGQVSVIIEHTDNDCCEDRRDDKQHHYADHERTPRSSRCLHVESRQRGTSWAWRLLRSGHSRGAPTKLVNAVADEHGMVSCGSTRSMPSCRGRRSVSVATDLQAVPVMLDLVDPVGPGRHLVGAGRNAGRDVAIGARGHWPINYWFRWRSGTAPTPQ